MAHGKTATMDFCVEIKILLVKNEGEIKHGPQIALQEICKREYKNKGRGGPNTDRPLCIRHHVRRYTLIFLFSFPHIFYLPLSSWDNQSVTFLPFKLFSLSPQD